MILATLYESIIVQNRTSGKGACGFGNQRKVVSNVVPGLVSHRGDGESPTLKWGDQLRTRLRVGAHVGGALCVTVGAIFGLQRPREVQSRLPRVRTARGVWCLRHACVS